MNPEFEYWLENQKYDCIKGKWKVKLKNNSKNNFRWCNIIIKYIISEKTKTLLNKRNESQI
jgi:hypothetical protein